jgi:predicted nucleotidyltransferase
MIPEVLQKSKKQIAEICRTLGKIQEELERIVHKPVNLVPKDGLKPLIRKPVLSEAEIVYEN